MKEFELINTIKNTLSSKYIGDDCAYLKDLGIVVTQDSLVENIHFSMEFTTPFQLGYKSVIVNLSDIYASGAEAKYLTVSLSLPKHIDNSFVKEFYEGAKSALNGAEIIGGDITGSDDKIYISITAIGATKNRKISSRKNAKVGYKVITNGTHGSSATGLQLLKKNDKSFKNIIKEHLMPSVNHNLSEAIATTANEDYAMMDSSDGLADALMKIADASNILLHLDFNKVPFDYDLKNVKNIDYKNKILFGGEDYRLVCAISQNDLAKIDPKLYYEIGEIKEKSDKNIVEIDFEDFIKKYTKNDIENMVFNHF